MNLETFIRQRPYLVWYVGDPKALSAEAILEATLNYGDWQDVQDLIGILGIQQTAQIFREKSQVSPMQRQNYLPEVREYFIRYFEKYA